MEPSAPLYARGAYRVLAASGSDAAGGPAYLVVDTAGTRWREEASFDVARDWVDRRAHEVAPIAPRPPRR